MLRKVYLQKKNMKNFNSKVFHTIYKSEILSFQRLYSNTGSYNIIECQHRQFFSQLRTDVLQVNELSLTRNHFNEYHPNWPITQILNSIFSYNFDYEVQ